MSAKNLPTQWISPTGIPWSNRCFNPTTQTISLFMRGKKVRHNIATGHEKTVDEIDAANGIVPNFIHALDASFLIFVVTACRDAGINSVMTVHDQFSCHASHATQFKLILLEQLRDMYLKHDPLTTIRESVIASLGSSDGVPNVPTQGDLDPNEITSAIYALL